MRMPFSLRAHRDFPKPPPRPASPAPIPCILLLEDEPPVRECLAEALAARGYAVLAGGSLEDGQAVLSKVGWRRVDLVITDSHLGRDPLARNGFAFHAAWRDRYPVPPFIFLDGWDGGAPPRESSCQVYGLAKPFPFHLLLGLIRAVLGR